MSRLEQLFVKLGYTRENGLFYLENQREWIHKFPYRISKVLRDIIQPFAFFSLHHHGDEESTHPEPINNPLILFFDKPGDEKRNEIPKWTFCFGQAPVIIINTDDTKPLDIFHGYQFSNENNEFLKKINAQPEDFSLFNLTVGTTWKNLYHSYFKNVPKVDTYLLSNIIDARRILIANDGYKLAPKIANRLIGRLLFVRYLIDRRVEFKDQNFILGSNKLERQDSLNQLIKDKKRLYEFFYYLTTKYNGDLFPLFELEYDRETGEVITEYKEEKHVRSEHLVVLYHLFSASSFFKSGKGHKGYYVQPSLFKVYDFEVIPVELISNIYENFIGKVEENVDVELKKYKRNTKQFEIKAYYTPPFIVDYILSQTISPFLEKQSHSNCKVLDPACGSGIFLVETLRKIVEKEKQLIQAKSRSDKADVSNERLWELLHENIFGIDIDADAIEITIFSLYITLLDYKTPIEIENFKFEELKGKNLFGGLEYDFFNEDAPFNSIFIESNDLNFIIGNPPWGKVQISQYVNYIKKRKIREAALFEQDISPNREDFYELEIGNLEIAQAFLVRVSDFVSTLSKTDCAFIVTGKCLYNIDETTKQWRRYFLSKFNLSQVVELSCVNNKIAGGNQIFEGARQSATILFYSKRTASEILGENVITHITVRPNRFFNYFRTIVIEKHDIKHVLQKYFLEQCGGNDWLWKVLLHGNILDYYFIKRLKDASNYPTLETVMTEFNLDAKGGLKIKDGRIKKSTAKIKNYKYLEIESRKELKPFQIKPSKTWKEEVKDIFKIKGKEKIDSEGNVGYLPDVYFFQGEKVLLKKGLLAADDFKAVAAYSDSNIAFTDSICSIKLKKGKKKASVSVVLKTLVGLINSKLFTYYIFNSSSSAGVDRTRAYFEEFFSFPVATNKQVAGFVERIQEIYKQEDFFNLTSKEKKLQDLTQSLDDTIRSTYSISHQEESLIDYSINVSLPVLKRAEETGYGHKNIFEPLSVIKEKDVAYMKAYAEIFVDHFSKRFNSPSNYFYVDVYVSNDFLGYHFIVSDKPDSEDRVFFKIADEKILLDQLGGLGIHQVTRDLYIQQDVRGFNRNTFYIIKPNERKCWHKAVAHHDLIEFIEALAAAEFRQAKTMQL